MPNKRENHKKRLSENLSLSVPSATKKHLAKCAKLKNVSMERIANEILDDFFNAPEWKRRNAWKLIERACYIIEEHEKAERERRKGCVYEE